MSSQLLNDSTFNISRNLPMNTSTGTRKQSVDENGPRPASLNSREGTISNYAVLPRPPTAVFGKSARAQQMVHINPGPGSYQTYQSEVSQRKGPKFNHSPKHSAKTTATPGPASYHVVTSTNKGQAAIITARWRAERSAQQPGPGAYNPLREKTKLPSWTMPRGGRARERPAHGVSPFSYNPVSPIERSSSCPFGKAKRFSNRNERSPGPADYVPLRANSTVRPASRCQTAQLRTRSRGVYQRQRTFN